jgi:prophage antirepressor-like protein
MVMWIFIYTQHLRWVGMWKHEEIAITMREEGVWFNAQDICNRFKVTNTGAQSVIKRIESCQKFNVELKRENNRKFMRILPDDIISTEKSLMRKALFGK